MPDGERKRPYSAICEICGRQWIDNTKRFDYHHWDNELPSMGLYLCARCHAFAEGVDSGLVDLYTEAKENAGKDCAIVALASIGRMLVEV